MPITQPHEGRAGWRGIVRALRHRDFRLFMGGQLVSLIGTWMQSVAQSWLVYRLTHSTLLLGLVGFCGQLPVLLLSPVGGLLADRADRRRTLVVTQASAMGLAFALAALTLGNYVSVAHVFVLAATLGVVNAFDIPTRQAFVVDIVGRGDLMNAIALNSSMVNGARVIGPALAGLLVAAIGEGWCFFVNGASFAAVIVGLLRMRSIEPPRAVAGGTAFEQITEGFRFAATARPVRALLLLVGLSSLMGMPYAVLMPVFADSILHGGARGLGILMGASGVGAFAGAMMLAARRELRGLGRWVAGAAGGFGVSLVLFSMSRSFWLSAALLMPVGFTMMVQMAASNTLLQSMAPDALRGRVMAVYSMMFLGMAPFGALLAGALATHIGPARTVALGGMCCVVAAVVFGFQLPSLRAGARALIVAVHASSDGEEVPARRTLP